MFRNIFLVVAILIAISLVFGVAQSGGLPTGTSGEGACTWAAEEADEDEAEADEDEDDEDDEDEDEDEDDEDDEDEDEDEDERGGRDREKGKQPKDKDNEEDKQEDEDEDEDEDEEEDDEDEGEKDEEEEGEWQVFEFRTVFSPAAFQTPYKTECKLLWPMIVLVDDNKDTDKKIPLPGDFKLERKDKKYYVDTDGDGKSDKFLKEGKGGMNVVFAITHVDDSKTQYQLTFDMLEREEVFQQRFDTRELQVVVFTYHRACYTEGEILGEKVYLVDDNSNGKYDDYGFDSIVIGKAGDSTVMSKMIRIGEKFYEFRTNLGGTEVRIKEYTGKTGELSVKYMGAVPPSWLIVGATGGEEGYFHNVAGAKSGVLPIGTYRLMGGRIVKGKGPGEKGVTIDGKMCGEFSVSDGTPAELALGAPFTFDFQYSIQEDMVSVVPTSITVFGSAREEYRQFYTDPILPDVMIMDATGKVVEKDEMKRLQITEKSGEKTRPRFDFETLLKRLPYPEEYVWKVKRARAPFKVKLQAKIELLGNVANEWK